MIQTGDMVIPTDDLRCAVWTAAQGFDPVGSATQFDRLVTVEVPHPWPADVSDMAWIAPVAVPAGTRVQAIVPEVGRPDGSVLLNRWERDGAVLHGVDWLVSAEDVTAALQVLASGDAPDGDVSVAPPEVLICGHGTRDRCCGNAGTRLTIEARARLSDVRVRRTSHLGGHRFAPTAVSLPDGRMWAFLDADALVGIMRRTMAAPEAREFYRGNAALDPWAQTLEADVLTTQGWQAIDLATVTATTSRNGDRASVDLTWTTAAAGDRRTADVEIVRRYPVLHCGLDPSMATKTSAEYRLVPTRAPGTEASGS